MSNDNYVQGDELQVRQQSTEVAKPDFSDPATKLLLQQTQQLDLAYGLAQKFCQTELVPKAYRNKPADGAVAIQWGAEIGLQPLQAMQNIAVINGNPSLWGDSLIALVKGSGLCEYLQTEYIEENGNLICRCITKRVNEPEEYREFSWNDAIVAGLANRDTYKNYPKRMLQNRARTHLLRDVYADVLKGFKVREIEEEDQETQQEKDITPRNIKPGGGAFGALTKKKTPKKPKPADKTAGDTKPADTKEFEAYENAIKGANSVEQLREIYGSIPAAEFSVEQVRQLKDYVTIRVTEMQESENG